MRLVHTCDKLSTGGATSPLPSGKEQFYILQDLQGVRGQIKRLRIPSQYFFCISSTAASLCLHLPFSTLFNSQAPVAYTFLLQSIETFTTFHCLQKQICRSLQSSSWLLSPSQVSTVMGLSRKFRALMVLSCRVLQVRFNAHTQNHPI